MENVCALFVLRSFGDVSGPRTLNGYTHFRPSGYCKRPLFAARSPSELKTKSLWVCIVNISGIASASSIEIDRYAEGSSGAANVVNEAVDAALRKVWRDAAAKLSDREAGIQEPPEKHGQRIGISTRGRIAFAHLSSILAVVAQGNYVVLQRQCGSFRLRESISVMAAKLEPYRFVRIHRSVLVNRDWVEEIRPRATGDYLLRLRGGKEFTVTRTYKRNLGMLAELWLGNDALFAGAEIG
jgi:hypothetical protein